MRRVIKLKRILLVFHNTNFYYTKMLSFAQAWERSSYCPMLLPRSPHDELFEDKLNTTIKQWRPHILFTINKPDLETPKEIIHINWQQDYEFNRIRLESCADLTYLVLPKDLIGYKGKEQTLMLHAGVDPGVFRPRHEHFSDIVFCGCLPPADHGLMDSPIRDHISLDADIDYKVSDLADEIMEVSPQSKANYSGITELINEHLQAKLKDYKPVLSDSIRNYIEFNHMRGYERCKMLDKVIESGHKFRIFGVQHTWANWPKYAKQYKGEIKNVEEMARVLSGSHAVLHSGNWGLGHYRAMETMSTGSVLLCQDFKHDDMAPHFEPFKDYIPWTFDTLTDRLDMAVELQRLNVRAKIEAHHTWDCRVEQIIKDIHG